MDSNCSIHLIYFAWILIYIFLYANIALSLVKVKKQEWFDVAFVVILQRTYLFTFAPRFIPRQGNTRPCIVQSQGIFL